VDGLAYGCEGVLKAVEDRENKWKWTPNGKRMVDRAVIVIMVAGVTLVEYLN
jgi:hypothetical protein